MTTVTFRSEEVLMRAIAPFPQEHFEGIEFKIDPTLPDKQAVTRRNQKLGNLLYHQVFDSGVSRVFLPQRPRVPHHLALDFKETAKPEQKYLALHKTIQKVDAIYHSLGISGFVLTQSEEGIVQIIPHAPENGLVRNFVDKHDCNRHVLFPKENISHPICALPMPEPEVWQEAFRKDYPTVVTPHYSYPFKKYDTCIDESKEIVFTQWTQILEDRGATIFPPPKPVPQKLTLEQVGLTEIVVPRCFFCDDKIMEYQLIFEDQGICLLNNIRVGDKPGANFLIVPRRHFNRVIDLKPEEVIVMYHIRDVLENVLKEEDPSRQVLSYIQDIPACGQTVFHHHMQVVSIDPDNVAWTWITADLFPTGNISKNEMEKVIADLRPKIEAKYLSS